MEDIKTNDYHFSRKILLIQMLLQIANDEAKELEQWLRVKGNYRLGIKNDMETLSRQSRKIRNEIYKALSIQETDALCDDIDALTEIFKKETNKFVGIKEE